MIKVNRGPVKGAPAEGFYRQIVADGLTKNEIAVIRDCLEISVDAAIDKYPGLRAEYERVQAERRAGKMTPNFKKYLSDPDLEDPIEDDGFKLNADRSWYLRAVEFCITTKNMAERLDVDEDVVKGDLEHLGLMERYLYLHSDDDPAVLWPDRYRGDKATYEEVARSGDVLRTGSFMDMERHLARLGNNWPVERMAAAEDLTPGFMRYLITTALRIMEKDELEEYEKRNPSRR